MDDAVRSGADLRSVSKATHLALSLAAAEFAGRAEEVQRYIDSRLLAEMPEVARMSEQFSGGLAASTRANVTLATAMLSTSADARSAFVAPEVARWATEVIRAGLPLETLLRSYHLGHAAYWQLWLDVLVARKIDAAVLGDVLRVSSAYTATWLDTVLQLLVADVVADRDRWTRQAEGARFHAVEAVLSDDDPVAWKRLEYELDRWHVAFIAWAPLAMGRAPARVALEQVGAQLATALQGDPRVLTRAYGDTLVEGWIGGSTPLNVRDLSDRLTGTTPVAVTVGESAFGLAGFRESHAQAVNARRVVELMGVRPGTVVAYRQVSLAALLTADVDHARAFVVETLAPLLADNPSSRRLLVTLGVFQEAGLSYTRAAARLGVHANTVVNRVSVALQLLGERDAGDLRLRTAVLLSPLLPGPGGPIGGG